MTPGRRLLVVLFAVLGLCAALVATWVHVQLLKQPSYSSFCDVNATISCTSAYRSSYGTVLGVPVAIFGVVWFATVLLLLAAERLSSSWREDVPGFLYLWSLAGLVAILYLAYGAFVVLRSVCGLCVLTYVAVIGVFLVVRSLERFPMKTFPGRLVRDLRIALTNPVALTALLLLLGGVGVTIAALPSEPTGGASGLAVIPEPTLVNSGAATPTTDTLDREGLFEAGQATGSSATLTPAQRTEVQQWYDTQQVAIMPVDGGGAAVVIVKFNDYQCPPCKQTWADYTPIIKRLEQQRPGALRYIVKDFPLEPECNPNVAQPVHPAACDAAVAVRLARAQSSEKADALERWIFANQATLTPVAVRTAAHDVGGVNDFDAKFSATLEGVKADAALGGLMQVKATPTFFINGRRIQSGVPPAYFEAIVEYALSKTKK